MLKISKLDVFVSISETKSPRIVKERPHIAFYDPHVDKMFRKKYHLNTVESNIRTASSFTSVPSVFCNEEHDKGFSKGFQLIKRLGRKKNEK